MRHSSFRGSVLAFLFFFGLSMVALPSMVFSAQIKIAWSANGETDLEGYRVYWGTAPRTYGTSVDVGNVTTYTIPNLTAGQTYYIGVTAHDTAQNQSGYSNEVSGVATDPVQTYSYTVTTTPSGLQVSVDGTTYTAPQTFTWSSGSSHTLSSASPQSGLTGIRYAFASWSDGGGQTHTVTTPSSATTYTASFTTQYSLTTTASPSAGGTVTPSGTN